MRSRLPIAGLATLAIAAACSDVQQATPSTPPATSAVLQPSTTLAPTTSTTAAPTSSAPPATTIPAPAAITRPYIDPAVCGRGSKTVFVSNDITYVPFTFRQDTPIPLQILAEPSDGVAKPFAVLLRLVDSDREFINDHPVVINGVNVYIDVFSNGNTSAGWTLPDGSKGYIRARELNQQAIESLVSRLTPRDPSAPIPGFDVAPATDGSELVLLHERMNTNMSGTTTMFQCQVASTEAIYRVQAIAGDPTYVYFGIIDVNRPYAVGPNGPGAITIEGGTDSSGPTVEQVVDADPTTWASLPLLRNP